MYTLHVQPFCTACLTGQEDERLFYMLSNAIFCYHLLFCDVHSLKKLCKKLAPQSPVRYIHPFYNIEYTLCIKVYPVNNVQVVPIQH